MIHFALNSYLTVIQSENKSLDSNKAATHNNIPPKILLQIVEATANTLQLLFSNALSNSEFPENLKLPSITPVLKETDPLQKASYRFVSILPPISKFLERLMQK